MKIFVQTASIDEIRRMTEAGLIDGVSLPIDELPDTEAVVDRLTEIEREFALPVCVPVPALIRRTSIAKRAMSGASRIM